MAMAISVLLSPGLSACSQLSGPNVDDAEILRNTGTINQLEAHERMVFALDDRLEGGPTERSGVS